MEQYTSKVEDSGRLLIPAVLRKRLGLAPGTEMLIEEENGTLRVQTRDSAIREVQNYFAKFDDGRSWSRELMAERRAEARREKRR
jgi:AbrB family looped-hinge helix DNA binding protein